LQIVFKNIDKNKLRVYNGHMDFNNYEKKYEKITDFHLPRYREIPNVGLYLEQSAKYINMCLSPLGYPELTTSMISNYVKQKIISGPYKKQYGAEHIACLIVLVIMKSVLSIEDIRIILDEKRRIYNIEDGYNILCDIFESQLRYVFRGTAISKPTVSRKKEHLSPSDGIVHNVLMAAVQKIHLDMQIATLRSTAKERQALEERNIADTKKKEKEQKKNKKATDTPKEGEIIVEPDDVS